MKVLFDEREVFSPYTLRSWGYSSVQSIGRCSLEPKGFLRCFLQAGF